MGPALSPVHAGPMTEIGARRVLDVGCGEGALISARKEAP
jgi:2-polyprenyl-3-methyl-5-hydroxy-6-metoxy-1,4-benzoquinol methylase